MREGVLTSSDFFKQKENSLKGVAPATLERAKGLKIKYEYKFPPAPKGISQTTVEYEKKSIKLVMNDGVYEIPEKWGVERKEKFHKFLLGIGFVDCRKVLEVKEKKLEYKIAHPDNAKNSLVNATVSVIVDGSEHNFECKDGIVTVNDEKAYRAFLKKGWDDRGSKEIRKKGGK